MTTTQPSVQLELDPQNPAQFFACCGVFELAAIKHPKACAWFVTSIAQPRKAKFVMAGVSPLIIELMIKGLRKATVEESPVEGCQNVDRHPITVRLSELDTQILLDWWLPPDRALSWNASKKQWELKTSDFKLWGGRQSTLKLIQDMLSALPDKNSINDFLEFQKAMSGRFGVDPRSAWNTRDFGSSPDKQSTHVLTYPVAEMLAAIGLQGFRPKAESVRDTFCYFLWSIPLPVAASRAAIVGSLPIDGQAYMFSKRKRSISYSFFTFATPFKEKNHVYRAETRSV